MIFREILPNPSPTIIFPPNFNIPFHLSREILSYFPKASTQGALMLDVGCGDAIHKTVCEIAGYEYVGVDFSSDFADILADAHALPFRNEAFEFIISIAVLEHIQYPFIMTSEVYRIIKTKGIFIGTVAFLEPFHGNSFYHHSYLGVYNSLISSNFNIDIISPTKNWNVLQAIQDFLFPKIPTFFKNLLFRPIYFLHVLWYNIGMRINNFILKKVSTNHKKFLKFDIDYKKYRLFTLTGSYIYIVHK